MIALESATRTLPAARQQTPTIWGLDPAQLHERFWATRRVQIVRCGEKAPLDSGAELYLLLNDATLAVFDLYRMTKSLNWTRTDLLCVRLHHRRDHGYREQVLTDASDKFVRFQRLYRSRQSRIVRVAVTRDPRLAAIWQLASGPRAAWSMIRQVTPQSQRRTVSSDGNLYDQTNNNELAQFVRDLTMIWARPDLSVTRAARAGADIWKDSAASVDADAKLIGPVWIGAGRKLDAQTTVIGPAILWDEPASAPTPEPLRFPQSPAREVRTLAAPEKSAPLHELGKTYRMTKRLFDIVVSVLAILITLPLYPFIMLAIWIEDGRPFFFAHRRETRGGHEFPCIKFRSMRRDAETIKLDLVNDNQADGPQFYMQNDPRRTRVGELMRKTHLDEIPQFFNVLIGHMSLVGPRPSPHSENQFCPPWREARLSVRPGITGLWQVRRTRQRGSDFQEWIRYDLEYVHNATWALDLSIIAETCLSLVRGITKS